MRFQSERADEFRIRLRKTAKGRHGAVDMTRDEAKEALSFLFSAEADPVQVAAFLTAMRFKGARADELAGFLDAMEEHSETIEPAVENLLNCNGPYDGRAKALHLSFASSVVAVAARVPVIMHSSDDLPPKKGVTTAQVLEALGIPAHLEPALVKRQIETKGFGFLHASRYNFGAERLRRVRETLLYRTFLHACEVMSNPARAKRSIIGAAHTTFLDRFAQVQSVRGVGHILVVQGLDGSDELPLEKIEAREYKNGKMESLELDPESFGLKRAPHTPCKSPGETAERIYETFRKNQGESLPAILYNGGVRIYMGGKADSIQEGIRMAGEIVGSGIALRKLESLAGPASL